MICLSQDRQHGFQALYVGKLSGAKKEIPIKGPKKGTGYFLLISIGFRPSGIRPYTRECPRGKSARKFPFLMVKRGYKANQV